MSLDCHEQCTMCPHVGLGQKPNFDFFNILGIQRELWYVKLRYQVEFLIFINFQVHIGGVEVSLSETFL